MRGAKPRTERECFGIGKSRGFGGTIVAIVRNNRMTVIGRSQKCNGLSTLCNRLFVIFLA